jgi:hypothetical protein
MMEDNENLQQLAKSIAHLLPDVMRSYVVDLSKNTDEEIEEAFKKIGEAGWAVAAWSNVGLQGSTRCRLTLIRKEVMERPSPAGPIKRRTLEEFVADCEAARTPFNDSYRDKDGH